MRVYGMTSVARQTDECMKPPMARRSSKTRLNAGVPRSLGQTEISFNTGAAYDPDLDAWSPLSITNAPDSREFHTAVWTGREMIVWGGRRRNGWSDSYLSTGGRYVPSTDRWTPIAAPSGVAPTR